MRLLTITALILLTFQPFVMASDIEPSAQQKIEAVQNGVKFQPEVNDVFVKTLGRDATQPEKQHFGALYAMKQYDNKALETQLKNSNEYRRHTQKDRHDRFVIACMNSVSMGNRFSIYRNDELLDYSIQCADRLMDKLGD